MIKKELTYLDVEIKGDDYIEVEKTETVKFMHTLRSVRLYEQRMGRNFFEDYAKASLLFTQYIKGFDIDDVNNLDFDQTLALMPLLSDPVINGFLMNCVPCMYVEVHDGLFVQNEDTASNAEDSLWFMELVNLEFFGELMTELSANQNKVPAKKTAKRSKNA